MVFVGTVVSSSCEGHSSVRFLKNVCFCDQCQAGLCFCDQCQAGTSDDMLVVKTEVNQITL